MKHDKNDLLRRQDCIEAIEGITCSMSLCVNADECHGMQRMRKQAVIELANMPAVQPEAQWIPVSEKLPERADNVIICYQKGDYTLVSTGRYLYKFKMWYIDIVGDLRDGVTAWMPLPELYKGGDSE